MKGLPDDQNLTITLDLRHDLPSVHGDRALVRQGLLKTLLSLRTACPETVHVSTYMISEHAALSIQASGCNLQVNSELARIFNMMEENQIGVHFDQAQDNFGVIFTFDIVAPKLILVIDDDESTLVLYQRYLSGQDYQLALATNGEEAQKLARETKPQLILLDVLLPGTRWLGNLAFFAS